MLDISNGLIQDFYCVRDRVFDSYKGDDGLFLEVLDDVEECDVLVHVC